MISGSLLNPCEKLWVQDFPLMDSGNQIKPGMLSPWVSFPISSSEISLAWSRALLTALRTRSSRSEISSLSIDSGLMEIAFSLPSHFCRHFHGSASTGGLDRAFRQICLGLLHLPLDTACLFHQFTDARHSLRILEARLDFSSGGFNVDESPFECFKCLLDQRILQKGFWVWRNGGIRACSGRFRRGACLRQRRWWNFRVRERGLPVLPWPSLVLKG